MSHIENCDTMISNLYICLWYLWFFVFLIVFCLVIFVFCLVIFVFLLFCYMCFLWGHPRALNQLYPHHVSFMLRPEPMLARSHTMPARGSFWPLWSDRRLYKVTMHWLHKFEANPADHQAVMWFFALGPPGWGREVRSSPSTSLFYPLGQSQPSCHPNAQ